VRPARAGDRSGMVRSIAGLSDVGLAWAGRPVRHVAPVRHSANALILPGPGGAVTSSVIALSGVYPDAPA